MGSKVMIAGFLIWLKSLLRNSSLIHVRQSDFSKPSEVIDLIDRFIDGNTRYDLEWDDFISWNNTNHNIEKLRTEIGKYEYLLFQRKDKYSRLNYCNKVIEQRNILASKISLPTRPLLTLGDFLQRK